jgi:hypothetical protein
MRLRINPTLDFVENADFDISLATYDDNYQNSQAHSGIFLQHMKDVLALLKNEFPNGGRIVEVGCGKGDFVELVTADGHFDITGYDATYEGSSPLIYKKYLNTTDRIDADLVVLRHVLEHIQAPHQFLSMLQEVFGTGKIYIEVPSYDWIIENQAFFDITYEHVNYFSQSALQALFGNTSLKSGLFFGDQYQYVIADITSLSHQFSQIYDGDDWTDLDFDTLFPNVPGKIASIEKYLHSNGKVYIWGAATKGCMFLAHCANRGSLIDRIEFAIDVNPQKSGKFLPGSLVAIKGPEAFYKSANAADILLICNPNYEHEIRMNLQQHGLPDLNVIVL